MPYDPDKLEEEAQEAHESVELTGEITEIRETTAQNIFGEDSMGDPSREFIEVVVPVDDNEITEPFQLPKGDLSKANPQSKLNRFKRKYGKYPQEDMTVELEFDENGFLSIAY